MNIKLNVPNKLSEIALSDYVKYLKILEVNEGDENSDVFVQQKVLEIFCGVPYNESLEFKMSDVSNVVAIINNTLSKQPELVRTFKLGDTEFGFIPKLDEMTFGEYIDVDSNLGDWENMHRVMSVLYRPIKQKTGDRYLIEDYRGDSYHDAMRHTPMDAVIGSMVFFWNLGKELSVAMINSLEAEKGADLTQSQILARDTAGITQFKHLLSSMSLK
ncbi:MAG: hypothetical protein QNK89_04545 [Lacinutrix sp.]|uniref:hypothetical protein n=1 Tax=Lacinutrix sp. TaxID=1937692 RepID=UPI00309EF477